MLLLLLGSALARAQPALIRVETAEGELSFDANRLLEVLRIELGTEVQDARTHVPVSGERSGLIRIERAPGAGDRWSVAYQAGPGAPVARRIVDLEGLPWGARPRGLALGIAELVRAQGRGGLPAPQEGTSTSDSVVDRQTSVAVGGEEAGLGFLFSAGARAFPPLDGVLFDPRIGLSWGTRRLRVRVDGSYLFGYTTSSVGSVSVAVPAVGLALSTGGGSGAFGFDVGPRVEVGYATLTGQSTDPNVIVKPPVTNVVVNVSAAGVVRVALRDRLWVGLAIELGYGLRGVEAPTDPGHSVGIGGPMAGLSIVIVAGPR